VNCIKVSGSCQNNIPDATLLKKIEEVDFAAGSETLFQPAGWLAKNRNFHPSTQPDAGQTHRLVGRFRYAPSVDKPLFVKQSCANFLKYVTHVLT